PARPPTAELLSCGLQFCHYQPVLTGEQCPAPVRQLYLQHPVRRDLRLDLQAPAGEIPARAVLADHRVVRDLAAREPALEHVSPWGLEARPREAGLEPAEPAEIANQPFEHGT